MEGEYVADCELQTSPETYTKRPCTQRMVSNSTARWESLEYWSPRLVLAAGVLFVGHAAVRGVEAFTTMPPPVDVFGPTGYVAALLGLLGLYPSLADRTPRMSRVAAVIAGILVPAWALVAGWNFGEAAGILPPQTTVIPGAFFFLLIVSTLLLYLLFGVASLRAESHTRTLGTLLLTPATVLVLLLVGGSLLSLDAATGGVIIGSGLAICHGAIGGSLLTGDAKTDHVDLSGDVAVE